MAAPVPRKRKSAVTQNERTVKTSLVIGVSLHVQLSAAAAMRGMTNNALVTEVLTEALRGIVVMDRRKNSGRSESIDRQSLESPLDSDDEIAA